MNVEETVLVAGLRAGEDWAYESMIRQYGGRLLSVARRFVRSEEDARDVRAVGVPERVPSDGAASRVTPSSPRGSIGSS